MELLSVYMNCFRFLRHTAKLIAAEAALGCPTLGPVIV